ncbi:MAG TPA: DinB family protein [Thermomicrobiales bacterium]|nr:DinB family protein [Thermomicrobiales bacterium]
MSMQDCARTDPPLDGDEKASLLGFLNYQRDTLLCKLAGLDDEQVRRPHVPSGLTLLGLVKHLTDVERSWFRETVGGEDLSSLWDDDDPQRYWRIEPDDTTEGIIAGYREEIARANAIVAAADLNARVRGKVTPSHQALTIRWVVLHMIEETARHLGHADLIRESIDGATGE